MKSCLFDRTRSLLCLWALSGLVAAQAGEFHWTGATDSHWTESGNWQERSVPGTGDTAVFGAIASGASSTVTVDGSLCRSMLITGANAPAYNFVNDGAKEYLTLENHGFLVVDSSVTQDQTFTCKIACTFSSNGADLLAITNNSTAANLVLGGAVWSNGGSASVYLAGAGRIDLCGQASEYAPSIITVFAPELRFGGNGSLQSWRPKSWSLYARNDGIATRIVISAGSEGLRPVDGGGNSDKNQVIFRSGRFTIDGDGEIPGRIDNVGYPYNLKICGGAYVNINAVLASSGDSTQVPRLSNAVLFGRWPDGGYWADRVVSLNSTNTFTGPLMIKGNVTVKAAKIGAKNCTPTESNIGCGSEVIFLTSGGTFDYTGPGENFSRDVHFHQASDTWGWSEKFPYPWTPGCIRNSGSGTLTFTGEVNAQEAPDAGSTGALAGYPTNCLFRLDGATAPIVFDGTVGGTHKFAFEAVGQVTLKAFPSAFTNLALASATVTIDPVLGGGSLTVPELFVTNTSNLKLPPNYVLNLGSVKINPGKALDLLMDDSAVVTISGASPGALAGVSINGAPARCNDSGRIVGDGTAWKTAANGTWAQPANWTDGVPSDTKPGRVNLAGTFTIALDSNEAISDFSMAGDNGQATVEVSGLVATTNGSRLAVNHDAEFKVAEGGAAVFESLAQLKLKDGGRLVAAGGETKIADATEYDLGALVPGVTSTIRTEGGDCLIKTLSTPNASILNSGEGFAFGGTAGTLTLCGSGSWYSNLYNGRGRGTNYFSGTAEFMITNSSCYGFNSNGKYEFSGNSRMTLSPLSGSPCCFKPYSADGVCEFEFKDHAAIGSYALRNYGTFYLGCPASTMANGVTRVIFDSDAEHYLRNITAGVERSSVGEVIQRQGVVHVNWDGIVLGTFWEAYWIGNSRNRGVYRMQGGVLDVFGGGVLDNRNSLYGVLVGWGMYDGGNTKFDNYRFSGRFELDGGIMTNQVGIVAIGCGRADGEFVQRGGRFTLGTNWAARKEAEPALKGNSGYPGVYLVGGFTGTGLWAISNGVMECTSDCEHTYVGGIALDTLRAHTRRFSQGSSNGSDVLVAVPDDSSFSAVGRFEVVDGTVDAKGDLIVGAAGHGEVDVVGSNGAIAYRNLVLSNNVESVVKFVFDANGVKPIALTGSATVTDGAKLVIDMSNFTGRRNGHPLITAAGGMTGRFENVTIVGDNEATRLAVLTQGADGVRIAVQRGMSISFR